MYSKPDTSRREVVIKECHVAAPLYIALQQAMICVMWHCVFIRHPMQFHFSDQICLPQAQYKNYIWNTVACTIPNILPSKAWVMIHSHRSPQSFYCSCSATKSLNQNLHANYCSKILYQDQIQGGFFVSLVFNYYKSYLLVWFLNFVVRSFGFLQYVGICNNYYKMWV